VTTDEQKTEGQNLRPGFRQDRRTRQPRRGGSGVTGAIAAPEPPLRPPRGTPKRKLGKTGWRCPASAWAHVRHLSTTTALKQAIKWASPTGTRPSLRQRSERGGHGRFFAATPRPGRIFLVTQVHEPKGGDLTERLDKSLKRLQTDHVDLSHPPITSIDDIKTGLQGLGRGDERAGKIKFFGFSTHTNMADCLGGAAGWTGSTR